MLRTHDKNFISKETYEKFKKKAEQLEREEEKKKESKNNGKG